MTKLAQKDLLRDHYIHEVQKKGGGFFEVCQVFPDSIVLKNYSFLPINGAGSHKISHFCNNCMTS